MIGRIFKTMLVLALIAGCDRICVRGVCWTPEGGGGAGGAVDAGGSGGEQASGGAVGSGGEATGGAASGGQPGSGGAATGGSNTGGASSGGASTGGASTGGANTGGMSAGGAGGSTVVQRPAYNTGTGFFVLGSKLYDATGTEFRIRGLNHLHWDSPSVGIPKTGANTERWDLDFRRPVAGNVALMQRSIANKMIPMPANWEGTCSDDFNLQTIVAKWVADAAAWNTLERYLLLNIANEWGPPTGTAWRDGYITAVAALRAAGIKSTLVIDAGNCGQYAGMVVAQGPAVLASDPQKNILFSVHIYGSWYDPATASWQQDFASAFDALATSGLAVIVGEFGPGRNIGPSPTPITPGRIIRSAEQRGIGWLAWAWDDPAGEYTSPPVDDWFAMSFTGDYLTSANLTTFGKDVVENPIYGLKVLAKPAGVFTQ